MSEAVKHLEVDLQMAFETSSDGLILLDSQGRILKINARALRLLKIDEGEHLKAWPSSFFNAAQNENGASIPLSEHPVQVALQTGERVHGIRVRFKVSNDTFCQIRISATPYSYQENNSQVDNAEGRRVLVSLNEIQASTLTRSSEPHLPKSYEHQRLSTIIDVVDNPIFVKDNDHRIILANQAFYKLFGLEEKDVIGKTHGEHVSDNERHAFLSVDRNVLDTGVSDVREETISLEGRPVSTVVTRKSRFIDQSGTKFLVGSIQDLTAHRKAKAEIRAAKTKLEAAFNSMSDAILITDQKGEIVDFNHAFAAFHKFANKEACAKALKDDPRLIEYFFTDGKSATTAQLPISAALRGETANGVELSMRRKDTGQSWSSLYNYSPIKNKEGQITGAVITSRDITEKKSREADYAFTLTTLGIGVWKYDIVANTLDWDDNMYRLYGIEAKDFNGAYDAWEKSLSLETMSNAVAELDAAIRGERDFDTTFKVVHKNGKIQDICARAFVIRDQTGKPLKMHGINVDRTREIELEKAMADERAKVIQNSKLVSLGELSAGVAHEINNPLAIIKGTIPLLTRATSSPEMFRKRLETLSKASTRIEKIVSGLKKFSRSSLDSTRSNHLLSKIVQETLILTDPRARQNAVKIQFEVMSEVEISCDEVAIEQVLINLINNAIDAAKDSNEKWVKIEISSDLETNFLRVIDSGAGIPENIRPRLFDPFFTTKPVGEGTGLGLSVTNGILKDHDASIELLNDLPNTCFEIRFKGYEAETSKQDLSNCG